MCQIGAGLRAKVPVWKLVAGRYFGGGLSRRLRGTARSVSRLGYGLELCGIALGRCALTWKPSRGPKGLIDLQRGTNGIDDTRLVNFSPVYLQAMLQVGHS